MANGYYTHTTFPGTNSSGSSASMRAELDAVMAGFTLLPNPLGSGQQGFSGGNWTNPVISGGSIDNASVGATSRSTGRFTTLDANGAVNFSSTTALGGGGSMAGTFTGTPTFSGAVVLSGSPVITGGVLTGGTINNAPIGGTTRAAGAFTTLAANAAVTFSSGGTLAGAFTGGAYSGATIDNTPIGGTTRAAGAFTTLAANAAVTFSAGGALTGTFTGTPTFSGAINLSAPVIGGGTINSTPVGATTPSTGAFTTLSATGAATFSVRPTFNSNTPWDSGNLPSPLSNVPVVVNQTRADSGVGAPATTNLDFAAFTSPAAGGAQVGKIDTLMTVGPTATPSSPSNWSVVVFILRTSDNAVMATSGNSGVSTMLTGQAAAFAIACSVSFSGLAASTSYFVRIAITGSANPGATVNAQNISCNGIIF